MSEPTRMEDLRKRKVIEGRVVWAHYVPVSEQGVAEALRGRGYVVIKRDDAGEWPAVYDGEGYSTCCGYHRDNKEHRPSCGFKRQLDALAPVTVPS